MYRIRVRRDTELLRDGAMVVRGDVAGGFVQTLVRGYERVLSAYWRLLRATVLR
jgi:hypothetical protein